MAKKGRMGWLPDSVLREADAIRFEKGLKLRAEALDELVRYARVGREAEKMAEFFGVVRRRR